MQTANRVYVEPLTERERQVALAVTKGIGNRAIARELGIAVETVKHHLSNVYGKTGVNGRLALAIHLLHDAAGDAAAPSTTSFQA